MKNITPCIYVRTSSFCSVKRCGYDLFPPVYWSRYVCPSVYRFAVLEYCHGSGSASVPAMLRCRQTPPRSTELTRPIGLMSGGSRPSSGVILGRVRIPLPARAAGGGRWARAHPPLPSPHPEQLAAGARAAATSDQSERELHHRRPIDAVRAFEHRAARGSVLLISDGASGLARWL